MLSRRMPIPAAGIAAVGFLAAGLLGPALGGRALEDDCTLEQVVFGKQLYGAPITEEDCEGRVTVFFTWGIT